MEDFHTRYKSRGWNVYGVFDGHGGSGAAKRVSEELPRLVIRNIVRAKLHTPHDVDYSHGKYMELMRETVRDTFRELDARMLQSAADTPRDDSGTTATLLLIEPRRKWGFLFNTGDSRSVVYGRRTDGTNRQQYDIVVETSDHNMEDPSEIQRIINSGGTVEKDQWGTNRVNGYLALTRAFGDFSLKLKPVAAKRSSKKKHSSSSSSLPSYVRDRSTFEGPVSVDPDMTVFPIESGQVAVLACDGFWDVIESAEVPELSRGKFQCSRMVKEALRRGTTDNVTVMVVHIK